MAQLAFPDPLRYFQLHEDRNEPHPKDLTLTPGNLCTESVTLTATKVGSFNGSLTFTDDSEGVPDSTQSVSLTGKGIQDGTTTTVAASPNSALINTPVTFSYSVVPNDTPNILTPTGTVTVSATTGESCSGSVAAIAGIATSSAAIHPACRCRW